MDEETKKEPEPVVEDMWQRGGSENLLTKGFDGMLNLLTSSFAGYTKEIEKKIKELKKFQ